MEVKSSALNFPSVTICNMNSLRLYATVNATVNDTDEPELASLQKLLAEAYIEDAGNAGNATTRKVSTLALFFLQHRKISTRF